MRLAPLVLLATSLSASTSGVAPFTWIQGRMTYVVPDSDCHCLKADTGFGLGAGAWVAPRLGLEVEGLELRLTSKGEVVRDMLRELFDRHLSSLEAVGNVGSADMDGLNVILKRMERFWIDQVRFRL